MTGKRLPQLLALCAVLGYVAAQLPGEDAPFNEIDSRDGGDLTNSELTRQLGYLHQYIRRVERDAADTIGQLGEEVRELQARLEALEHQGQGQPIQPTAAFESCQEVYETLGERNEEVVVRPLEGQPSFPVYCQYGDSHQWTMLQHRIDPSVDFNRDWAEYRDGFGERGEHTNYWLGLEKLRLLTSYSNQRYLLRIDLVDWSGETAYAEYSDFTISGESSGYRINYSFLGGPAGDSLDAQGTAFSTRDRDLDTWEDSCSNNYQAGWWFKACLCSNLNGPYHYPPDIDHNKGLVWERWKGAYHSYKESTMRFRPMNDE